MGWMYTRKAKGETIREFFARELGFETEKRTVRLLDCAVVNLREAYLAFEDIDHTSGNRQVFAVVCLLHYQPNSYWNFGYKDMEESMGPCYYKCPERILKLLTPTSSEYALKWRKRCWEHIERRRSLPRLRKGDVVEFSQPIKFSDGSKVRGLRVLNSRKLLFEKPDGYGLFKLRKSTLERNSYRVVEEAA